jgi:hypothetical protein
VSLERTMPFSTSDLPVTPGTALSGLHHHDLWIEYFALGGHRSATELRAYLYGATAWPGSERAIAAQALKEHDARPDLAPGTPAATPPDRSRTPIDAGRCEMPAQRRAR